MLLLAGFLSVTALYSRSKGATTQAKQKPEKVWLLRRANRRLPFCAGNGYSLRKERGESVTSCPLQGPFKFFNFFVSRSTKPRNDKIFFFGLDFFLLGTSSVILFFMAQCKIFHPKLRFPIRRKIEFCDLCKPRLRGGGCAPYLVLELATALGFVCKVNPLSLTVRPI